MHFLAMNWGWFLAAFFVCMALTYSMMALGAYGGVKMMSQGEFQPSKLIPIVFGFVSALGAGLCAVMAVVGVIANFVGK